MTIQAQRPTTSKRVLVVDDDESLRALVDLSARSFDPSIDVDFVTNGEDAVQRLSRSPVYDLVLVDFLLEEPPNGLMLRNSCKHLLPDCSFTMMSSMPLDMAEVDPADFLKKPFTVAECQSFLAAHLEPQQDLPQEPPPEAAQDSSD